MIRLLGLFMLLTAPTAALTAGCSPYGVDPLEAFQLGDALEYVDLPDAETTRATSAVEAGFVAAMVAEEIPGFAKTWCEIGISRAVVDFDVPVEDDAIGAKVTRAVYIWDAGADGPGWRLDQIGTRLVCAQGPDPYAEFCP